jgi:hypothetical protein
VLEVQVRTDSATFLVLKISPWLVSDMFDFPQLQYIPLP